MTNSKCSRAVVLVFVSMLGCGGSDGNSGGTGGTGGSGNSGTDHPTAAEAASEVATPLCGKLAVCYGDPSSQAGCVQAATQAVPASEANVPDTCTNSQVDTCVADIGTMTCPASTSQADILAALPASCQNC